MVMHWLASPSSEMYHVPLRRSLVPLERRFTSMDVSLVFADLNVAIVWSTGVPFAVISPQQTLPRHMVTSNDIGEVLAFCACCDN